jgi:hypothetical protein
MNYIGIDVHRKESQICIVGAGGELVLPNSEKGGILDSAGAEFWTRGRSGPRDRAGRWCPAQEAVGALCGLLDRGLGSSHVAGLKRPVALGQASHGPLSRLNPESGAFRSPTTLVEQRIRTSPERVAAANSATHRGRAPPRGLGHQVVAANPNLGPMTRPGG